MKSWTIELLQKLNIIIWNGIEVLRIEGHHKYNAVGYSQIADDSKNIYPGTKLEHLQRWHGGNFQNDISGVPNDPSFKEEF